MDTSRLSQLLQAYRQAPPQFHATSYWQSYEEEILQTIAAADLNELRSGRYPVFASFGFSDVVYTYHPNTPWWKNWVLKLLHRHVIKDRRVLPYGLRIPDIQRMAYHYCKLRGELSGARSIRDLAMSTFGNPGDLFKIQGRAYSVHFLSYYLRYCFVQQYVGFQGEEIVVELGSGSGYQIEILKKLYPGMTILCFDLPAQIFLCETYLTHALGRGQIVGTEETAQMTDLSGLQRGLVYCFGNWQFPLLEHFKFDGFWNAASFGEMEPAVVQNYLSYVLGNAEWIYLLQARRGKETVGRARVRQPITFEDYARYLPGYSLRKQQHAYQAHKRLTQSGGYFEAVWVKEERS